MNPDEKTIRDKAPASESAVGGHLEQSKPPKSPAEHDDETPAAGPHAKPELTNPDATPGSGMFPEPGDEDEAAAPPSG